MDRFDMSFDISSPQESRQTLQRSDAFLQKLILSSVDGVIAADKQGNILIFNEAASDISGYNGKEVFTQINIRDLYPKEGAKAIMRKLRSDKYGGKGKLRSYKVDVARKNGKIIPIMLSAAIIYEKQKEVATIGFFHDLREEVKIKDQLEKTQIQLLQAEKRASQNRLTAIIESFPSGSLVVDENARVILINPAFKKHLNIDPDQPVGEPIESYISDDKFCRFIKTIPETDRTGAEEPPTFEFAPSPSKYLLAKGSAVRGDNNENLGSVIILVDITAIKLLDRLKTEFVAKVSHELKSPLCTIHEQLNLVLADVSDEGSRTDSSLAENHHILFRARERTNALISLIGDLLDISRIETGAMARECATKDLDTILSNTVDFYRSTAAQKKLSFILEMPETALPPVNADPIALQSIFSNLITNAIHYTPSGGTIAVRMAVSKTSVSVAIRDNGLGIEKKYLKKIFNRFYRIQTDKTRMIPGTGLGLSIAKELLTSIGGSIDVTSEPDKGSVFTMFLPIAHAPDPAQPQQTRTDHTD